LGKRSSTKAILGRICDGNYRYFPPLIKIAPFAERANVALATTAGNNAFCISVLDSIIDIVLHSPLFQGYFELLEGGEFFVE
jgi:hypothetical protein